MRVSTECTLSLRACIVNTFHTAVARRTAQRGSASMSLGRHSSERKAVSSKALAHSGGSNEATTEGEPRREGEHKSTNLAGLAAP